MPKQHPALTGSFLTATSRPDLDLGPEHFTPVAFFARDPQAVMVLSTSPWRTFKQLLDHAKREPGEITCAVTSATGTGRQTLWRIERETGAKFKFVTFKGGAEAVLSVRAQTRPSMVGVPLRLAGLGGASTSLGI